jgi:hypothetical protein
VTLRRLRITGGNATFNGGGILVAGAQLTIIDCTVTGNRASLGGGILTGAPITTDYGWVTLDHSDVTGNTAVSGGGGIYNSINSTLTLLNGSRITGNTATGTHGNRGGGILNSGRLYPSGGVITGNTPDNCYDSVNGTGCPPT